MYYYHYPSWLNEMAKVKELNENNFQDFLFRNMTNIKERAAYIALEYRYKVEEFLTEWEELDEPGSPTQQDYEDWHLANAKSFFHDVMGSLEGEIRLKGLTEEKQKGLDLRAIIRESLARELGQRVDLEELADAVADDIAASWLKYGEPSTTNLLSR